MESVNGADYIEIVDDEDALQFICCINSLSDLMALLPFVISHRDLLFTYDSRGRQCTHTIAMQNRDNAKMVIEIFVELGADINAQELINGNTLLHIAVSTQNYQLAEWLCQQANIQSGVINHMFETAYHIAYKTQDLVMMELLRTNGAVCDDSVDVSDNDSSEIVEH